VLLLLTCGRDAQRYFDDAIVSSRAGLVDMSSGRRLATCPIDADRITTHRIASRCSSLSLISLWTPSSRIIASALIARFTARQNNMLTNLVKNSEALSGVFRSQSTTLFICPHFCLTCCWSLKLVCTLMKMFC